MTRILCFLFDTFSTDFFTILARLTIPSPTLLFSALEASTTDPAHKDPAWLLDEWLAHIDAISHPDRKKLSCLALTSLLETSHPLILSRLQLLMTMWTSVLVELETDERKDCLVWPVEEEDGVDVGGGVGVVRDSPGQKRATSLSKRDVVHVVETREFVRVRLGGAVEKEGGMEVFRERWVGDVDGDVLKAFGELGVF